MRHRPFDTKYRNHLWFIYIYERNELNRFGMRSQITVIWPIIFCVRMECHFLRLNFLRNIYIQTVSYAFSAMIIIINAFTLQLALLNSNNDLFAFEFHSKRNLVVKSIDVQNHRHFALYNFNGGSKKKHTERRFVFRRPQGWYRTDLRAKTYLLCVLSH